MSEEPATDVAPSLGRTVAAVYALAWLLPAFVAGYAIVTMFQFDAVLVPDYVPAVHGGLGHFFLDPWQHWDGQWYLRIAERGYYPGDASAAFLPAYPMLARAVRAFVGDTVLSGCLVSWVALAGALVTVARLFREEIGDDYRLALVLLVTFPTAFYFHAAYTESLFLFAAAQALLAARERRFVTAGAFALVATLTRWTGFVLVPTLLAEAWAQAAAKRDGRTVADHRLPELLAKPGVAALRSLSPVAVISALSPLAAFPIVFRVLDESIHDPMGFDRAQRLWERRLAPPWQGLVEGVTVLLPGHPPFLTPLPGGFPRLPFYPGGFLEAHAYNLVAALAALALAFVSIGRLRASSAAFALASAILPLMTPSRLQPLQSVPRFFVVMFPLFAVLALLVKRRPLVAACLVAGFAMLQGFFVARFALWFWVA
ncbi:MAG TPA: hypothetical protein VHE30_28435 [Polyangiaceae bacterium]|nr:hypothetical protein [Polyangiaceae bacterium]